jgi:uncharacterized membrane protein YidH (DUF202 family)
VSQERTALAWRRTTLSLVVVGIVTTRFALESAGPALAVAGAVAVALGLWVLLITSRAALWAAARRGESDFSVLRDGRLPAMVTAVAVALAVVIVAI